MTITFVGSVVNSAINGGNITLSLSGIAGITTGDFVYVISGVHGRAGNEGRIGNALGFIQDKDQTTNSKRIRTAWKHYNSATDGTLTIEGSSNNQDVTTGVALVFRGSTARLQLNTATQIATGTGTTNPDPPAITPPVNNCVIVIGATSSVQDTTPGTVTNYTEPTNFNANNTDTNPQTTCGAYRILSGGGLSSENPAAFSTWTSSNWLAITASIQEQVPYVQGADPMEMRTPRRPRERAGGLVGFSQFVAFDLYPFNWDILPSTFQPPRRRHEKGIAVYRSPDVYPSVAAPALQTADYAWFQTPLLFPRKNYALGGAQVRYNFGIEATYRVWVNDGWQIAPVQPPQTKQEKGAAIIVKDEGTTGRYQFWVNDGWEATWPQPPHPRPEKAGAIAPRDEGISARFQYWINDGWQIAPFQPPQTKQERWAAVAPRDEGIGDKFRTFVAHFDVPMFQPPQTRPQRGAVVGRTDDFLYTVQNVLQTADYAWYQTPLFQPPHAGAERKYGALAQSEPGTDETPYQQFFPYVYDQVPPLNRQSLAKRWWATTMPYYELTSGLQTWTYPWSQVSTFEPRKNFARGQAIAAGHAGIDSQLVNWLNWSFENQTWHPRHPRPERAGILNDGEPRVEFTQDLQTAAYAWFQTATHDLRRVLARHHALGHSGIDAQFVNWLNWSFESQSWHPRHPRPERAGILNDGEPRVEFDQSLQTAAYAWFQTATHDLRRVLARHHALGHAGIDSQFVNWLNWTFENQTWHPSHPRPERAGILNDGEPRIDFTQDLQTAAYAWFQTPLLFPRRRYELAGSIMPQDDGNYDALRAFYPNFQGPFFFPRKPFERAGAIMRGDVGAYDAYRVWLNWTFENQSWHPRHPRPERAGVLAAGSPRVEFTPPVGLQMGDYAWFQTPFLFPRRKFELAGAIMRGDVGAYDTLRRFFDYGFAIPPMQPPHPRSEKWAALLFGEPATDESIYRRFFDYGFAIPPPQPPQPYQRSRWAAIAVGEPGTDETQYARWINDGWQIPSFQPPRVRRERTGLFNVDTSLPPLVVQFVFRGALDQPAFFRQTRSRFAALQGAQPIDSRYERWVNYGWPIQPLQPPHRAPEQKGAGIFVGDVGSYDVLRRWFYMGWEIPPFQPPHRAPEWKAGSILGNSQFPEFVFNFVPPPPIRSATHARVCDVTYNYVRGTWTGSRGVDAAATRPTDSATRPSTSFSRRKRDDGGCC